MCLVQKFPKIPLKKNFFFAYLTNIWLNAVRCWSFDSVNRFVQDWNLDKILGTEENFSRGFVPFLFHVRFQLLKGLWLF